MNSSDDLVICRCEGVRLGEIRESLKSTAAKTVNEVKKLTRAGMGMCQGRTCAQTLELVLAREGGAPAGTEPYRARPPLRPAALGGLAEGAEEFAEPEGPVSVVMLRKPEAAGEGGGRPLPQNGRSE
jgi:bacterioferritin-associated ferredoxin